MHNYKQTLNQTLILTYKYMLKAQYVDFLC